MSEELLKELLEETKKQNKMQEEIKREMELQNDLVLYEMLRDKSFCNHGIKGVDVDRVINGRLYARLSDEDRSILERFKKPTDRYSDEARMYNLTTRGLSYDNDDNMQEIISDMHIEILNDVYTERELYDYFSRMFERIDYPQSLLNSYWEKEWQSLKTFIYDDDCDEEEWEIKQKHGEMYENRITKKHGKIRNGKKW